MQETKSGLDDSLAEGGNVINLPLERGGNTVEFSESSANVIKLSLFRLKAHYQGVIDFIHHGQRKKTDEENKLLTTLLDDLAREMTFLSRLVGEGNFPENMEEPKKEPHESLVILKDHHKKLVDFYLKNTDKSTAEYLILSALLEDLVKEMEFVEKALEIISRGKK